VAAIHGVVVFPEDRRPPAGAIVRFRVEDATYADAPAAVAATATRTVERDGVHELPFSLDVPDEVDPERHSVRVHVDRNGSGEIEVGDWVSFQRHRLASALRIPVVPVE
jgi:uncharacterized lipoprotein YbaY